MLRLIILNARPRNKCINQANKSYEIACARRARVRVVAGFRVEWWIRQAIAHLNEVFYSDVQAINRKKTKDERDKDSEKKNNAERKTRWHEWIVRLFFIYTIYSSHQSWIRFYANNLSYRVSVLRFHLVLVFHSFIHSFIINTNSNLLWKCAREMGTHTHRESERMREREHMPVCK